ncbi:dUTP diphosphatase [Parabacteroides distasonis]|jgi:dUTP pyrophosphatase|uniref:dUTP diphosphatase n=1 Tax=Parabacteroides distasonis TaxID=823 RepID=UPI000EFACAFC|nr:dUTP diphosphatase [Parabacteroides distasonis]RGV25988.1 dUTP diphosphatase [Parabacteroides distasonis]
MKVKIKRLTEEASIPFYSHATDAEMDLTAVSLEKDNFGNYVYGTGIAIEIPDGYVGLVFPRSSNHKKELYLTNSVGVIDSGYRGEIKLKFKQTVVSYDPYIYDVGDRIGQLIIIPYPRIEFVEVDRLSDSDRGTGGYGSTGD